MLKKGLNPKENKMKKSFKLFFAGLMALSVGASLVACNTKKCKACEECEHVVPHEHTFSSEWTYDDASHWHAATCEHSTLTSDLAAHSFGEWTEITPASETSEGLKSRECSICHYVQEAPIDKLEHTHTFSDAWTSNETHHWHESTCAHKEIADKAAHTPDREKPDYKTPVKCSVCGRVLEENLFDSAVIMSNDDYEIKAGRSRFFELVNYGEPTQLRVNVDYISGGGSTGKVGMKIINIPRVNNSIISSTYATFTSLTPAQLSSIGRWPLSVGALSSVGSSAIKTMFVVENNTDEDITLRLNNVTYEYKLTYTATATIHGNSYKYQEFSAQNGVKDVYYAVDNATTNTRVGIYRDIEIKDANTLQDGYVKWKDGSGNVKQFTIPHTTYKSAHYRTNETWYVDEYSDQYFWMWLTVSHGSNMPKIVDFWMNDETYGVPTLFTATSSLTVEQQFEALALFGEYNMSFKIYNYYEQFNCSDGYAPYGVYDYEEIVNDAQEMTYDSSNRNYIYNGDQTYSQSRKTVVIKLTTAEGLKFNRFYSLDNNNAVRDPNKTSWSDPYLYRVYDADLNEITGYNKMTTSGYIYDINNNDLTLMPSTTYYIIGFKWLFNFTFKISQKQYMINFKSHAVDGYYTEGQKLGYISGVVTGQTYSIRSWCTNSSHTASEDAAIACGQAIVGYTTNPNGTALSDIQYLHNQNIVPGTDNIDLYAVYADIEELNVITTLAYISSYSTTSTSITVTFGKILDTRIESLVVGEAVFFVNKYGNRFEAFVRAVTTGTSGYTVTFGGLGGTNISSLAYIAMETEYDCIFALDVNGMQETEIIINKGETFDLASLYDQVIVPSGSYLYSWVDLDTSEEYAPNTVVSFYHGSIYIPDFVELKNSKVLTLYQEFETGENNVGSPYIEFTIQDINATLNSDSNVTMTLRDGTVITDSVARILNSSNSTIASATASTGTIKVFLNATTLEQLQNVVMLKIA